MSDSTNLHDIPHYKKRYNIVVIGAVIICVYQAFYFYLLNYNALAFTGNYWLLNYVEYFANKWIIISIICLVIILISYFFGTQENHLEIGNLKPIKITERTSLTLLIVSTVAFLILLSFPILFTGGSHSSVFGAMLITAAGLIVIITQSQPLRFTFAFAILTIHLFFTFRYCTLSEGFIINTDIEKWLYFFGMLMIIVITLILSWKSKTIFDHDKELKKD